MNRSLVACVALLTACATPGSTGHVAEWIADTSSFRGSPLPAATPPTVAPSPLASYAEVADKIIAAARADKDAYAKLAHLTDHIGARLSGSPALTKAIAWAVGAMKADGEMP